MKYVTSPVIITNPPIKNSNKNAMPIDPTSPAKHFAFPFCRKLNRQNTTSANNTVIIKEEGTKDTAPLTAFSIAPSFTIRSGTNTAAA